MTRTAVEAITFTGLVSYGIANNGNVVDGAPWSFTYQGCPVSHENTNCYLINKPAGETLRMGRNHVLVTLDDGELLLCEVTP